MEHAILDKVDEAPHPFRFSSEHISVAVFVFGVMFHHHGITTPVLRSVLFDFIYDKKEHFLLLLNELTVCWLLSLHPFVCEPAGKHINRLFIPTFPVI